VCALEISVVVPVRDGVAALPTLFAALAEQTLPRERFEVVVVDNGSRDDSAAVARRAGAVVVAEGWANRARARNVGVAAAGAQLLAFTDADCAPEPGWLAALVECLAAAPLVAGPVRLQISPDPGPLERFERLWRFDQERNVREHGWAASANLGMRREPFEAVRGFDPAYREIGEDVDLCLRARASGYPLGFCERAVVRHDAETRLRPILARAFRHGWSSNQHHHRLPMQVGWVHWRHPLPALRGDWALARFGVDPSAHRDLRWIARAEYAARVAGSAWAELRRAR
jgi:GT2 family glycosyltransferase